MDTDEAYVSIVIWPRVSGYFRSGSFWIHHLTIKFSKTIWESVHDTAQGWFGWLKKAVCLTQSQYQFQYQNTHQFIMVTKKQLSICVTRNSANRSEHSHNYLKITTKYRLLLRMSTEKAVSLETVKYWNTLY